MEISLKNLFVDIGTFKGWVWINKELFSEINMYSVTVISMFNQLAVYYNYCQF